MILTKHAEERAYERFEPWEAAHVKQAAKYAKRKARSGKAPFKRQNGKTVVYDGKYKFVFDGNTLITVCRRSFVVPAFGADNGVATKG